MKRFMLFLTIFVMVFAATTTLNAQTPVLNVAISPNTPAEQQAYAGQNHISAIMIDITAQNEDVQMLDMKFHVTGNTSAGMHARLWAFASYVGETYLYNNVFRFTNLTNLDYLVQNGQTVPFLLEIDLEEGQTLGDITVSVEESGDITGVGTNSNLFITGIGNFPIMGNAITVVSSTVDPSQPMHRLDVVPALHPHGETEGLLRTDSLYVLPGQSFIWSSVFNHIPENCVDNSVIGVDFYFDTNLLTGGVLMGTPFFSSYLPSDPLVDGHHLSWVANGETGINGGGLLSAWITNNIPVGQTESLWETLRLYNYSPSIGMVEEWKISNITLISSPGIRGDVSGDQTVDSEDVLLAMSYISQGSWETHLMYTPPEEHNLSRSCIIFQYPTVFHTWLTNIWINNPDNDLVDNLGIDTPFDGTWPVQSPVEWSQTDNTVTVNLQNANCIGVHGYFPNGEEWSDVRLLQGDRTLQWSSATASMEPTPFPLTREEITIELPEGLTNVSVEGRHLNQATETEDENVPSTPGVELRNYPNPFNPTTTISFSLAKQGNAKVDVFNARGQLICQLVNEQMSAGNHQITWNGTDQNGHAVSSGVYFSRLTTAGETKTKKMMLMK